MAIIRNGKVYRNIQEQVLKNTEDIEDLNHRLPIEGKFYTEEETDELLALKADKSNTYTKEECNETESVNINLNESMIDSLLDEYNDIINKLYNIKNEVELDEFIATFDEGYKKERFKTQLKRVYRVHELNAPILIKQNEKIMLMDFFVLYKTVL